MDIWDIYVIFGLSLSVIIITSITLIKILKRNPKNQLNIILALTFICYLIHVLMTFQRVFTRLSVPVLIFQYQISFYILALGLGFLSLYVAILYKPEIMMKFKSQSIFMLLYEVPLALMFFIPEGVGVTLTPEGYFSDGVFYLPMTVFLLTFFITTFIIMSVISVKIYKSFIDPELIKRMKLVTALLIVYYYHLIGLAITNFINDPPIRHAFYGSEVIVVIIVIIIYFTFSKTLPLKKSIEE